MRTCWKNPIISFQPLNFVLPVTGFPWSSLVPPRVAFLELGFLSCGMRLWAGNSGWLPGSAVAGWLSHPSLAIVEALQREGPPWIFSAFLLRCHFLLVLFPAFIGQTVSAFFLSLFFVGTVIPLVPFPNCLCPPNLHTIHWSNFTHKYEFTYQIHTPGPGLFPEHQARIIQSPIDILLQCP